MAATVLTVVATTALLTAACGSEPTSTRPPATSASTATTAARPSGATTAGTPVGTSPTTAAGDTTTTATAAGPPTTRTGDNGTGEGEGNAIRKVDFANFTFPPDACGTTFAAPPAGGFTLTNGEVGHGTPASADFYSLTLHVDIAYGDVTGDGNDEAAILLDCNAGTRPVVFGWIYTLNASGPASMTAITFGATDLQAGAGSPAQLLDVRLVDQRVVSRWAVFAEGDAACCPSQEATLSRRWNGTALVRDDAPR